MFFFSSTIIKTITKSVNGLNYHAADIILQLFFFFVVLYSINLIHWKWEQWIQGIQPMLWKDLSSHQFNCVWNEYEGHACYSSFDDWVPNMFLFAQKHSIESISVTSSLSRKKKNNILFFIRKQPPKNWLYHI